MPQNSKFLHKSPNVTVLLYHLVSSAKIETCGEIEKRYELRFLEVCIDKDHVHFLIQSVPTYSVTKIVTMVKSIIAREVFKQWPELKKQLWGGEFWGKDYFINTVGQHGTENMIAKYVKEQEKEYRTLKKDYQLKLF